MSKPKQRKSGSKSRKRTPGKKTKPKCGICREILRTRVEISLGHCDNCLYRPRSLDPEDTLARELQSKERY